MGGLLVSGGAQGHQSVTGTSGTPFNPTPYAQLPLTIMTIVDGSNGGDHVIQGYSLRGARRDFLGGQRDDRAWPDQLDDRDGRLNRWWRLRRHGSWHWRIRGRRGRWIGIDSGTRWRDRRTRRDERGARHRRIGSGLRFRRRVSLDTWHRRCDGRTGWDKCGARHRRIGRGQRLWWRIGIDYGCRQRDCGSGRDERRARHRWFGGRRRQGYGNCIDGRPW